LEIGGEIVKLFLALLMIRLFCPNYFTVDTIAYPLPGYGTLFDVEYHGEMHIFSDSGLYSGDVTLVINDKNDELVAVFER
jgi:hypothetical protein